MFEREVAKGIHRIENVATNWYLVEEDDKLTVVDAGVPRSWRAFMEALAHVELRIGSSTTRCCLLATPSARQTTASTALVSVSNSRFRFSICSRA